MFGDNDNDGIAEALQEDHYYPFGLQLADGGQQAAAPTVDLYNGKELQDELGLGWYDYGARMLNPAIGRWNGVDRLAEKYISHSPFHYGLNNPIYFLDVDGDSISFKDALNRPDGLSVIISTLSDLTEITGLNLSFNTKSGMLSYAKDNKGRATIFADSEGIEMGSSEARNMLISAIDNTERTVMVDANPGEVTKSKGDRDQINLNRGEIQALIDGTPSELNFMTAGFGMVFLHELDHSKLGRDVRDYSKRFPAGRKGHMGQVVGRMNIIRRQLDANPLNRRLGVGSVFGERTQYLLQKGGGKKYLPWVLPGAEYKKSKIIFEYKKED